MKIAITGPHCSGKTTLLSRVKTELSNYSVKFIEFDGTTCPINYFDKSVTNNEDQEIGITLWMLSKLLLREIEVKYDLNYGNNTVIFDRCLLDQLVYPLVNLKNINIINIIGEFVDLWLSRNPYDLIFYVPKNEDFLKSVPNFNQDLEYLENVERTYLSVLEKYRNKLRNVIVLPVDQDEQKSVIISVIQKNLNQGKQQLCMTNI